LLLDHLVSVGGFPFSVVTDRQARGQAGGQELFVPLIVTSINVFNLLFIACGKNGLSCRIVHVHFLIDLSCLLKNLIEVAYLPPSCYTTKFSRKFSPYFSILII
jgi:hypothetical protein